MTSKISFESQRIKELEKQILSIQETHVKELLKKDGEIAKLKRDHDIANKSIKKKMDDELFIKTKLIQEESEKQNIILIQENIQLWNRINKINLSQSSTIISDKKSEEARNGPNIRKQLQIVENKLGAANNKIKRFEYQIDTIQKYRDEIDDKEHIIESIGKRLQELEKSLVNAVQRLNLMNTNNEYLKIIVMNNAYQMIANYRTPVDITPVIRYLIENNMVAGIVRVDQQLLDLYFAMKDYS